MNHRSVYRISLLLLVYMGTPPLNANEIPNCNFEDTIDLTNAHKFSNGSYLYDNTVLIPADRVGIYDYEEVFEGKRVPMEPHPRGCICNGDGVEAAIRCIKFCCPHPVREYIANNTNRCVEANEGLPYSPYLNITYRNGSSLRSDVTKDFLVLPGEPCDNAYALDIVGKDPEKWKLFENGSLSIFRGEVYLTKRDYCMMFTPKENGKEMILSPMLCPVRVVNEEHTLDVVTSIADIISTLFIILTLVIYLLLTEHQNLQGKCFIFFLISLALGTTFLGTIALPDVVFPTFSCGFLGYTGYFFLLTSFCWLNVICYNMFKSIEGPQGDVEGKKYFPIYSGYAFGLPLSLTIILIIIQNSNIPNSYKSGIGGDYCWFDPSNWSAMIYYFGINAILLCLDISFYFVVILTLRTKLKSQPDAKDILLQIKSVNQYGLLLLIMSIACFFDTITSIASVRQLAAENICFYISSFVNAIFGFVIFMVFGFGPLKRWRHQRLCLHKGYAIEERDIESIEISQNEFS